MKPTCRRNHQFTPENTHLYRGYRVCIECRRMRAKKFRDKRSLEKYGPEGYSHFGNQNGLNKNLGEDHGLHKLTEAEVLEIRDIYAGGTVSQRLLAEEFHVNPRTIYNIIHRLTWKHV